MSRIINFGEFSAIISSAPLPFSSRVLIMHMLNGHCPTALMRSFLGLFFCFFPSLFFSYSSVRVIFIGFVYWFFFFSQQCSLLISQLKVIIVPVTVFFVLAFLFIVFIFAENMILRVVHHFQTLTIVILNSLVSSKICIRRVWFWWSFHSSKCFSCFPVPLYILFKAAHLV